MTSKRFIQVWLDLDAQNGCWNCKNDCWSICKINNIGTVGYIRGISHCALKDWEYDADKHNENKLKYSWFKQYLNLLGENKQLRKEIGDLGTAHAEEINKIEDEFDEEILKLEKENKELKQRISEAKSMEFQILYRDIENLKREKEELKYHLDKTEKELQEYKDFMSLG